MIFGPPATADRNGRRLVEFQNTRLDAGPGMRAVAKGRILRSRAAAIRNALRHLMDNCRLDQIVVGQGHFQLLFGGRG